MKPHKTRAKTLVFFYLCFPSLLVSCGNVNLQAGSLTRNSADSSSSGQPRNAAVSIAFVDTDGLGGRLSGTVSISKAVDESNVTHYGLYWGSNEETKLDLPPIAMLPAFGSNLAYNFRDATVKPAEATHILVRTKNKLSEMPRGIGTLIVDKGLPTNAAISIAFTDTQMLGGQVGGDVSISKAANESDLTDYVVYWGSNGTTKLNATPLATLAKTGNNLTVGLPLTTAKPGGTTHLLVFSKNSSGEMPIGVSTPLLDLGVPTNASPGIAFADTELLGGKLGGTISISKAVNEADLTHYTLYWGHNATAKLSQIPFATVAKTGGNLIYTLAPGASIPTNATHLLAFTKNADGEMATGANALIIDLGVPVNPAASLAFTDTDLVGGKIGGSVTVAKAADESDLSHYVLYWGSSASAKLNATPLATLSKTGGSLTQIVPSGTTVPVGATHMLVFTKNADGEMATGRNVLIVDKGVPVNLAASIAFTDSDLLASKLGGSIVLGRASSEADLTHYVLYWGSNATTKLNATAITAVAKTVSPLAFTLSAGTGKPTGATHILVFTKNADGEMATGKNALIVDKAAPTVLAASVAFSDTDNRVLKLGGTISIGRAANETNISHYVLYWGSNATTKLNSTPIMTVPKATNPLAFVVVAGTNKLPGATHILVFTKNADGEMATGKNTALVDLQ